MNPTRKLHRSTTTASSPGLRFVALAMLGGSGLVIYMAMWIIAPTQP